MPSLSFGPNAFADAALSGQTLSTQGEKDRRAIFTLLLGAESRPGYFGAEDNIIVPRFSPNIAALNFGQLSFGDQADALDEDPNDRPLGFGVGGSFRFITERSSDDYDELDGLDDVDFSLEVGALIGYVWPNVEAFGALRYGVVGHESWVGELGAYYVARPTDDIALRIGPRFLFGSDRYTDTYFGVTEDEAAESDFEAYDPDGGLVSAGVEVIATYQIGRQWWLEGRARWDQFQNDAADSPIVEQGATDQGTLTIGVRRAFVLDF
ncbi:MAG: MipA/OmpV family protein [Pseudomonadota bacterium]